MSYYEFTGKSIKEAVARACEELKVDEALLEVEVLEESSKGFLGIVGHREARIRVKLRDIPKEVMDAQPAPVSEPADKSLVELSPETHEAETSDEEDLDAPTEPRQDQPLVDPGLYVETAREVLQAILERIPVEVEISADTVEGSVYLDIKGDGSGLLIGKKGQTLDALQFIVNKIVNKFNPPGQKVEIIVDTENYRERKKENLREVALKAGEKAKKTHKPVPLEPMQASERRIIHMILAEDRDVYTKSYGEGQMRRLIVYPRKALTNKRRRR
jgi:spoIIIJ-associated protein